MATFPGAVKTFTTKNTGNTVEGSHINDLQDEVTAIEQAWLQGASPLNSSNSTFANLSVPGSSTLAALIMAGQLQLRGQSVIGSSAASGPFMRHDSTTGQWQIGSSGLTRIAVPDASSGNLQLANCASVACSTKLLVGNSFDVHSTQGGGIIHIKTRTTSDPSAPSTGAAVLYTSDTSGKTQLAVRFATGAVQILATEP